MLQAASRLKMLHGYLMCMATNLTRSIVLSIYNLPRGRDQRGNVVESLLLNDT
jgi:hypothetical protein